MPYRCCHTDLNDLAMCKLIYYGAEVPVSFVLYEPEEVHEVKLKAAQADTAAGHGMAEELIPVCCDHAIS